MRPIGIAVAWWLWIVVGLLLVLVGVAVMFKGRWMPLRIFAALPFLVGLGMLIMQVINIISFRARR